jgi:hypothetical protein
MKKIFPLVLLFLLLVSISWGKEVPGSTAKIVGHHFLTQKGLTSLKEGDLSLIYAPSRGGLVSYYVFGTDRTFVIVAGDDAVEPVLGYATDNTFRADHMPPQVSSFMDGYAEQIAEVAAGGAQSSPAVARQWQDLIANVRVSAAKTTAVTPLLTMTWDQGNYYNADCPYDFGGGGRSVTGCVATAMAQVMKFWSWPTTGVGMHSYSSSCCGSLYANFGATTYNWASMPNSVTSPNAAVAKLMSHCGISVDMNYSASTSGAYVISTASPITHCAEYAMRTYFNYKSTLHGEKRSSYTESGWKSLLKGDLDLGRPIVMAGFGSGGGHCFVCDGYDASDFFHMNWGWSGSSNGYFNINALNPGGLGTGGGSGGYNSNQQAIIGVVPNSSTTPATLALADWVNLSATSIFYGSAFSVTTRVRNTSTAAFSGTYCAAAFNSTGAFVTYVDSLTGVSLGAGATSGTLSFSTTGLLSMLPGNYTIGVFYRPVGGGWVSVGNAGSYTNFEPLSVVNNNPMQLYSAITPSPTTFVQGSAASVNLNLLNDDVVSFSGSYDVSLYNLDGSFSSTIQTMSGMTLPSGFAYTSPYLTFSTTSVTSPPGTYFLAVTYNDGSGWYLCGSDYFTNPVMVTVAAPPPSPDIYEVNNTLSTAYSLPLTWSGDVATKSTTGSNIHVSTDNDYYKITLGAGYNYAITARVNDVVSSDDAVTYGIDVVWSYSTDNGATWSSVYTDVMTGTINLSGGTGGTVIFRVSPAFAGNTGKYLLKLSNITRSSASAIQFLSLAGARVFPNPASDMVNVDLSGPGASASSVSLTDVQGRQVYHADLAGLQQFSVPVSELPSGTYVLMVQTDAGVLTEKIGTVKK